MVAQLTECAGVGFGKIYRIRDRTVEKIKHGMKRILEWCVFEKEFAVLQRIKEARYLFSLYSTGLMII